MRRFLYALWIISLIVGLWCNTTWAKVGKGPKIVLKEEIYDFNEVKEGEIVEHTFQVFNKGNQLLEIKDINPG